jgi:hypothetical protein
MISWRIWQAIDMPFVAHPIYRRYAMWNKSFVPKPKPGIRSMIWQQIQHHEEKLLGFLLLVGIIVIIFYGPSPLLILAAATTGAFIFIAVPSIVLFSSTFYGLSVAIHLSDSIAIEKKQGRYIFMSLTPYGLAGTAWAMCSVTIHTHPILVGIRHNLMRLFLWLFMLSMLGVVILSVLLLVGTASSPDDYQDRVKTIYYMADAAILGVIILTDYMQSTIIGCIVGMLTPSLAKTPSDIRNFATGIFNAVQFGTYIVIILLCAFGWPVIYSSAGIALFPTFPLACLVTFYLLREVIIAFLWLLLAWHTNTRFDELEFTTRVEIRKSWLFKLVYKPISLIDHKNIKILREEVGR